LRTAARSRRSPRRRTVQGMSHHHDDSRVGACGDAFTAVQNVSQKLQLLTLLQLLALSASTHHVPSTPQWLTFYNTDLDPVRGQQNLSNLVYSPDLGQIDNASRDFGIDGMWSGPWGCEINVSRVWGEPYCNGPTGLWKGTPWKSWGVTASWKVGATWVVEQVKSRPHIRGIFLGDEPTLFGVPYADICALSLHLKRGLLEIGRRDVFIYFNDTPESQQLKHGLCPGLDFFSLDAYNDDPATEVAQVKHAYSKVKARLRPPNYLEPRGQGFFVVPGIFWSIHQHGADQQLAPPCNAPGGTVCTGPDHKIDGPHDYNCSWSPAGTHCLTSPSWLVGKMAAYWAWARADASIVGINPWHWADVPGMDTAWTRRGAVSLGPELRQWFAMIHGNISAAGPRPLPPPAPPPPKPPLPAGNVRWDPHAHGQDLMVSAGKMKATWSLARCCPPGLPEPIGCNEAVRTSAPLLINSFHTRAALQQWQQRQQQAALTVQLQAGRALVGHPFMASVGVCTGAFQNFSKVGHYHPLLSNESWMYSATGMLVNATTTVAVTPWSQPGKGVGPNRDVPSANISVQLVTATAAEGSETKAEYFMNDVFVGSLAVPSGVPLFGCAASCANGTALGMRANAAESPNHLKTDDEHNGVVDDDNSQLIPYFHATMTAVEAENFSSTTGWEPREWAHSPNYFASVVANVFLSRRAYLHAAASTAAAAAAAGTPAVATALITIAAPGTYTPLVRFEAPHRYEVPFQLELLDGDTKLLKHTFGRLTDLKVWAFGAARAGGRLGFDTRPNVAPGCAPGLQSECIWPWGATENMVWQLAPPLALHAKTYTLRLTAVEGDALDEDRAGPILFADRNVDAILFTPNASDLDMRLQYESTLLPFDGLIASQAGEVFFKLTSTSSTDGYNLSIPRVVGHSTYWDQHLIDPVRDATTGIVHSGCTHRSTCQVISVAAGATSKWVDVGAQMDTFQHGSWDFAAGNYTLAVGVKRGDGDVEQIAFFDATGTLDSGCLPAGLIGPKPQECSLQLLFDASTRATKRMRHQTDDFWEIKAALDTQTVQGQLPKHVPVYAEFFSDKIPHGECTQCSSLANRLYPNLVLREQVARARTRAALAAAQTHTVSLKRR
jgi:hypothetical protein